jgi:hypothetical protein
MTRPCPNDEGRTRHRNRAQLVLVAAVVMAVALIPLTLAYLQLGYGASVPVDDDPVRDATGTLDRALVDAADGVPDSHAWSDREGAIDTLRERLRPTLSTLNRSRLDDNTALAVTYNDSRAAEWASEHCPGGAGRVFGPCRADRGVVVQERADRTHVLAVAVDIRVSSPAATHRASAVVTQAVRS